MKFIDEEIFSLGQRMDELLSFLNSHGALEEYVALNKQLSLLKNELNRVQEYQKILKAYRDTDLDIKASLIAKDKETDDELLKKALEIRKEFVKEVIDLIIKENPDLFK